MSLSDKEIICERYSPDHKEAWDEFIETSKNGTFLFNRDYMDYHSDRFPDNSLLFYRKGKLYSVLPATRQGEEVSSHAGLTYGGLVMNRKTTTAAVLEVFNVLIAYLRKEGARRLVYKPVPYFYSAIPAEEDLYALFRHGAQLTTRNVSSLIDRRHLLKFSKDRRAGIRKALASGIKVAHSQDFASFWPILEANLQKKYGERPVHSLEEIELLRKRFPENIKLFIATDGLSMMGGMVCYVSKNAVHSQYISGTPEGKKKGALDLVISTVINEEFPDIPYFDFGISNEDGGRYLNETLIYQKEGFGARAVCYDTYEILL